MDQMNPYEAPAASLTGPGPRRAGTGSFSIRVAWDDAWTALRSNFGQWLGGGIVLTLLIMVSVVSVLGAFLAAPVLAWGGMYWWLKMSRGQDARVSDLFAGFNDYVRVLGRMLLLFVLMQLVSLLGQSVQLIGSALDSGALIGIGVLLNLVWSVLVNLRLGFAIFFTVDEDLPAIDAMRASWEATRGNLGKLLLLVVLSGALMLVGLLALGVGVFPAAALWYFMFTSAYRQIAGDPAPAA